MRSKLLFLLLLIIPIVNAELYFDPSIIEANVMIGQQKSYDLQLTNNFNYTIFDIQFSSINGLSFSNITSINPGTSAMATVTAKPTSVESRTVESIVSFNYLISVPSEPEYYDINITNTGFVPSGITIREGDSITWHNIDDISHILSSSAFGGDIEVSPNQTYQRTFSLARFINYQDNVLLFGGTIDVRNRTVTEYAHDSLLDQTYPFRLEYSLVPTTMEFNITEGTNQTVAYGNTNEGLIRVRNIGDKTALNITFTSSNNWISFDENLFNLDPGQTNFLTFKVSPIVYQTSETNKTYTIGITMDGVNTESITNSIQVFVPYINLALVNESDLNDFFKNKLIFCNAFNTSPFCISEPVVRTEEKIVVNMADLPYNFTQEEIATIFSRLQKLTDANDRAFNLLKRQQDIIETVLPEIDRQLNESKNLQIKNEKKIKENSTITWIIVTGLIIAASIVVVIISYGKYHRKEEENKIILGKS